MCLISFLQRFVMNGILGISLSQLSIMFAFMLIGFVLVRLKKIPDNTATVTSQLIYWVFIPALTFNTMAANVSLSQIGGKLEYFFAGIATVAFALVLAYMLQKRFGNDRLVRAVLMYSVVFSNFGYLGYPVIRGIYGEEMMCNVMIMCVPYNVVVFSWAVPLLSGKKFSGVKDLLTPAMVGLLAGIAAGLLQIRLPDAVTSILSMAGDCMAPCAMLLAGCVLARCSLRELFGYKAVYYTAALRLLIIPLFYLAVMNLIGLDKDLIRAVVLISALPFGINTIVFPEANGQHSPLGASCCIIATLLSFITVPFVCQLIEHF